jgi:hypothetical protein
MSKSRKTLEIVRLEAIKRSKFLESKKALSIFFIICFRGGIAVVWLGLCQTTSGEKVYVAMKQFPKQGSKVDQSA